MDPNDGTLRWTAQLNVTPLSRPVRLQGDKINLPPSALEALLAAAPVVSVPNGRLQAVTSTFDPFNPYSYAAERHARDQLADRYQQLPHPLTFRLVNPHNGRVVYAGIREFSAQDAEIGLSTFLRNALGLEDGATPQKVSREGTPNGDTDMVNRVNEKREQVTVHAKQLPRGTYVRLRPLEAGYDPEDWKSLLERYLRDNFTTLTNGELLTVPGGRNEHFRFLVDKFEPEGDGICIVDTDLEVDIEALNEEQARETLHRSLAKAKRAPGTERGSSAGGKVTTDKPTQGQVRPGDYVDYELKDWKKTAGLEVQLTTAEDDAELDLFVSPLSPRQRSRPRDDEHVFGDFSSRASKRVKLSRSNVALEHAEALYISVHAYWENSGATPENTHAIQYTLSVSVTSDVIATEQPEPTTVPEPDEVVCQNCRQCIPKRKLPLHEAFCYRNNILCPQCSNVFLKNSAAWKNHWHCPHGDDVFGNDHASYQKHDAIFHPTTPPACPSCGFEARSIPALAHHRTSTCPGKEILCQFCHLVVPQQGPDDPSFTDPEVLLSGLTPHELADGARTTECHLCNKIVRLRDMRTHLKLHDRERLSRPTPKLCSNAICGRTIPERERTTSATQQLGLCSDCFGPLYITTYDPEGKSLRRRVERRLLQQLMAGCGKPWCNNVDLCRTGHKNHTGVDQVVTARDAMPRVKPVMDGLMARGGGGGADLHFCVDEGSQRRRALACIMAEEGEYELAWCVRALEEEHGELGRAREWLSNRAPTIHEVVG